VTPLLALHAAATWTMVGVIWYVQRVHYPLLGHAGAADFAAYQRENTRRTAWIVLPPMVIEALTSVALLAAPPPGVPRTAAWIGLGLVAVIWSSTALMQVPRHRRLERGYDRPAHRGLVATNWVRTVAWSARGGLVFWMMLRDGA